MRKLTIFKFNVYDLNWDFLYELESISDKGLEVFGDYKIFKNEKVIYKIMSCREVQA